MDWFTLRSHLFISILFSIVRVYFWCLFCLVYIATNIIIYLYYPWLQHCIFNSLWVYICRFVHLPSTHSCINMFRKNLWKIISAARKISMFSGVLFCVMQNSLDFNYIYKKTRTYGHSSWILICPCVFFFLNWRCCCLCFWCTTLSLILTAFVVIFNIFSPKKIHFSFLDRVRGSVFSQ